MINFLAEFSQSLGRFFERLFKGLIFILVFPIFFTLYLFGFFYVNFKTQAEEMEDKD